MLSDFLLSNLPFSLDLLPQPVYLVGGSVRDAILGRSRSYLDLDFIIQRDAVVVARQIATHCKAGFVLLDAERQIARVVFPDLTVDFAQQEGDSLDTDLRRRDYTINAIAYNPHTQEIIDPLGGCIDLEARTLRMISPANLQDDPLRLLRGYRQASQLGFSIEANTQAAIRSLASYISKVAHERVRVEIGYMLGNSQSTPWLISACADGLLRSFFKHATGDRVSQLTAVDNAAALLTSFRQEVGPELQQSVRDTVKTTWLGIAKLACLVSSDPDAVEVELLELSYSKIEARGVATALRLLPKLKKPQMSLREQYFLFQDAGMVFLAIAVLSVADGNAIDVVAPLIDRYLNPDDPVAHPKLLVSGKEVMEALKIPASPLVGKLLTEIAVAQVEGKVATVEEALEFAAGLKRGSGEWGVGNGVGSF